ncbi:hypothetical protein DUNSADRAFT_8863 [Dunaliella salina]|uniref:Uncharacterized protein n=1 Tax=Dunaliella salina TaxID=3046 RepID=A0ABQ7H5W5_DUNSA|nr:hypothetical protein DUNSADRAFT_8863 [Dunaliella salina]|eukprot:KAF5842176.1 hypothetical protein DUNSADRAFT_8863 [Dunaliella salina]
MLQQKQKRAEDTELFSQKIQAPPKKFFMDLRKYLKMSEKSKWRATSSVVVPASGVPQVLTLMRFYLDEAGRTAQPQELSVERKVFSFNAGSNDRGQFLRVMEHWRGSPFAATSLMVPMETLRMFVECLQKVAAKLENKEATDPAVAQQPLKENGP